MKDLRGQTELEIAAALIAIFIFVLGTLQIFVWLNQIIVQRQQYYESSRVEAGSFFTAGTYNYVPSALNIFNK